MKGRIVVIEDDDYILQLLHEILGDAGYETIGVSNADQVLSALDGVQPDLFVIDVMLREKSGIEVADKLWLNGFADVPMIAISASTVMREIARQIPLFRAVINKPFDIASLVEQVDELIASQSVLERASASGTMPPVLTGAN